MCVSVCVRARVCVYLNKHKNVMKPSTLHFENVEAVRLLIKMCIRWKFLHVLVERNRSDTALAAFLALNPARMTWTTNPQMKQDLRLKRLAQDAYTSQAVEILAALKKLGEQVSYQNCTWDLILALKAMFCVHDVGSLAERRLLFWRKTKHRALQNSRLHPQVHVVLFRFALVVESKCVRVAMAIFMIWCANTRTQAAVEMVPQYAQAWSN